jgi:multimeric flavodoxin WrbA
VKVLAINTSPEKDYGAIALLLDPFLEGMREAGADVVLYYSRDLLIFPCCGNLNCTVRTPGQCMACDDMRWLRHEIGQADVLVLASPLYFNGFTGPAGATGPMKRLLDRLAPGTHLPGDSPYLHAIHTTREQVNLRKVVIVSGCGFWEIDDFYPVLTHLKALCYNSFPELAGCITGTMGASVRGALPESVSDGEIIATARAAGRELVMDYQRLASLPRAMVACDGTGETATAKPAARTSGSWREWGGEILFEPNMKL